MLSRNIVFINCALGFTIFAVNVKSLVPWHEEIAQKVDYIQTRQKMVLEKNLQEMESITLKHNETLAKEKKGWFFSWMKQYMYFVLPPFWFHLLQVVLINDNHKVCNINCCITNQACWIIFFSKITGNKHRNATH